MPSRRILISGLHARVSVGVTTAFRYVRRSLRSVGFVQYIHGPPGRLISYPLASTPPPASDTSHVGILLVATPSFTAHCWLSGVALDRVVRLGAGVSTQRCFSSGRSSMEATRATQKVAQPIMDGFGRACLGILWPPLSCVLATGAQYRASLGASVCLIWVYVFSVGACNGAPFCAAAHCGIAAPSACSAPLILLLGTGAGCAPVAKIVQDGVAMCRCVIIRRLAYRAPPFSEGASGGERLRARYLVVCVQVASARLASQHEVCTTASVGGQVGA